MNESKRSSLWYWLIPLAIMVAALVCIIAGTAQAAIEDTKWDKYEANLSTADLSVTLLENEMPKADDPSTEDVNEGELLTGLTPDGEKVKYGYTYSEVLSARNDGQMPEYVRVVINKYWLDDEGKAIELDPNLIELGITDDWIIETDENGEIPGKPEQVVLYSKRPIQSGRASNFVETLRINPDVLKAFSMESLDKDRPEYVWSSYDYAKCDFAIDVEVSSVQINNAESAIKSAWGVDMNAIGISLPDAEIAQ